MRWLLLAILIVPIGAGADAGDQLCRSAGGSSGCLDYGRRDGYRPEPVRPPVDPAELEAARQRRWQEIQESIRDMERPRPEPAPSADVPSIVREDVKREYRVVEANSSAFALSLIAPALIGTAETALLVDVAISIAPYVAVIAVSALVIEEARRMGWIFAKNRKPPADAWDPNGAKAPGRPGAAEGFDDSKKGPTWGQAPNGDWGWVDNSGDIWVPSGPHEDSRGDSHGGPHWDVQPKRSDRPHVNVYPGGRRRE